MEDSQGYSFLFCDVCGTLVSFGSHKYAKCALCGFKRPAKEFVGREIRYSVTAEEFRRDLNKLEPFVKPEGVMDMNMEVQQKKKVSNLKCTQCNDAYYEYHELQIRSADEGMTVYYDCPKCHHKFNQNN